MVQNNNLPHNWSWVKLGDAVDKVSTTGIKLKQKEYLLEGKYPVVDQGQELVGGYSNDGSLVVKTELPMVVFGDHTKVKKFIDFKFIAGADGVIIIKPKKEFFPKLFFYFLHCIQFPDKGYARHFQYVEKENIPLPPLPEQKKIVEKIEELFSGLDSGVVSLKKAKAQIRLYRQSVLASAFSGKLVNAAYLNGVQGVTHKKAERLNAIQEFSRAAEPKVEYSNQLPDGWKWVKLEEVISFLGSGVTPRGGRNVYKTEGIKFIRSQNVYPNRLVLEDIAYITNDIDEKMERSRVMPLDVLLNITGASIGRAANIPESFGPANVNQHVCILRTNQNEVRSKYLSLYLNSNFAQQHINRIQIGATRQALNYSQIKMFPFPLCPVNQQTQIVEEIEKRFSEADNLEKAIDESLAKSETLRQSILKKAFEGKLV